MLTLSFPDDPDRDESLTLPGAGWNLKNPLMPQLGTRGFQSLKKWYALGVEILDIKNKFLISASFWAAWDLGSLFGIGVDDREKLERNNSILLCTLNNRLYGFADRSNWARRKRISHTAIRTFFGWFTLSSITAFVLYPQSGAVRYNFSQLPLPPIYDSTTYSCLLAARRTCTQSIHGFWPC